MSPSTSRDRYGLPLTTRSTAAAASFAQGLDRLLAFGVGAEERFQQALLADDGLARAHVALAVSHRLRGQPAAAQACATQALALTAGLPPDEQRHVAALAAFVEQPARALPRFLEHLREVPNDALTLQLTLLRISRSSAIDWQQRMYALLSRSATAYGDDWWFLGAYALAHAELHQLEAARTLAARSLVLNPSNAGAAHPLAHVFYETNDHAGGAHFLEPWLASYDRAAPFHCHLAWHLALFALADGDASSALDVYEREIRPLVTQAQTGLVDAAALLWRLQLAAHDQPPSRWNEVGRLARHAQPGLALEDAHAALALAATGDEAALAHLIDGLKSLAARGSSVAERVVLPLVLGIAAFGRGEYAESVRQIEPIVDQIVRIGGSNVQREVFEETLVVACARSGQVERANALLRRRMDRQAVPA